MAKQENPFYNNYVFSKFDLSRAVIRKWEYPLLWLLPTYVQLSDGHSFYYKRFNGRIYLMRVVEIGGKDENKRVIK